METQARTGLSCQVRDTCVTTAAWHWRWRHPRRLTLPHRGRCLAAATPSSRLDAVNPKPETALLRVATHTLETLTATLRAKPVPLDAEDRAAFAAAVKKSLDAVLHCR